MKKTLKPGKPVSAESIGKRAELGEDVSRYFTNAGRMMPPVQRVNVDFAQEMLHELDVAARDLNVSRQAVIKVLCDKRSINITWLKRPETRKPQPSGLIKIPSVAACPVCRLRAGKMINTAA